MELNLLLNNVIIKMDLGVLVAKFKLDILVSIIYTQNLYAIQFVEMVFQKELKNVTMEIRQVAFSAKSLLVIPALVA
ncbi:MAG TPA: hypothetical protein PLD02_16355 [Saprospiraceae bacterium]|nr:hypothetical protein [Saprospiraceae bacterium]